MRAVFISSTFRDMQFERDAVQTRVLPRLNDFLSRYAETARFGDLRWGVNTTDLESDDSSKKVLRVCLDQIDDCKPYMIVFIGERYGWIPSRELLREAALLKGMQAEKIEENTSVTELEIEYGALLHPDLEGRILFYFRNPFDDSKMTEKEKADYRAESPLHAERVEKLKKTILEKYPSYVRTYDVFFDEKERKLKGLEGLTDCIYEDLKRIFDIDLTYLNSLPKPLRAVQNAHAYFTDIAKDSFPRAQAQLPVFRQPPLPLQLARFENAPLFEVITGEHGAGSKTVMAQRYVRALAQGDNAVCFAFGADEFSQTSKDMFSAFIYRLEEFLQMEHTLSSDEEYFVGLCAEYAKRKELPTLRLFAINLPQTALSLFHRVANKQPALFNVSFCVHFKKGFDAHLPLPFFLKSKITTIPPLTKSEQRGLISSLLKVRRKELSDMVVEEILKRDACRHPVYLALLTQRLIMLDSEDFQAIRDMGDGMDNINKYMLKIVKNAGEDTKALAKLLLKTLILRVNPVMIPHLIAHLVQPYHFPQDGVKDFFDDRGWNFSALDYTLFKKTFPSLVHETKKGFLFFANDEVKEGAKELLAEEGYGDDLDETIAFLRGKSETYHRKALPLILHAKGDSEAFSSFFLQKMDVPTSVAFRKENNEKEYEIFSAYVKNFLKAMENSYENQDGFAQEIVRSFARKIIAGEVKNPYTVASFLFLFIQTGSGNYAENVRAFDFVIELISILDGFETDDEAIAVLGHILKFLYVPLFQRKSNEPRHAEFARSMQAYNQTQGPIVGRKLFALQQKKEIILTEISNRLSVAFYGFYDNVRVAEDPFSHPSYEHLYATCKNLEAQALHYFPDYYERLQANDLTAVRALNGAETQAFWLASNAYLYLLQGDEENAKRNYDAFFRLHELTFEKQGMQCYYFHDYLSLLNDYAEYILRTPTKASKDVFLRLYSWGEELLCEYLQSVDCAGGILRLLTTGMDNDFFDAPLPRFYAVYTILKDNLKNASTPDVIYETILLFNRFSFAFFQTETNGERKEYFLKLLEQVVCALTDKGMPLPKTVETLVFFSTDYCEENGERTEEFLQTLFAFLAKKIPVFAQTEIMEYALLLLKNL